MSDTVSPDLSKHVFSARSQIKETKPEIEKYEELLYQGHKSVFWQKGLKPYIEARMEALNKLLNVELKGTESMEELGTRFVISNAVGEELQDLINKVEATAEAVERIKNAEKDTEKPSGKG